MPDEPTLGEVVRRLEAVHQDLKEDLREYGARLDTKVSFERYQLEQQARDDAHKLLAERVRLIEEARRAEVNQREADRLKREEQRRNDRRWIIAAILVPVVLAFLQAYLSAKGAGG